MKKSIYDIICELLYLKNKTTVKVFSYLNIVAIIFILYNNVIMLSDLILFATPLFAAIILFHILYMKKNIFLYQHEIQNLRIIQHDFSKHIGIIRGMLVLKEFEQLSNYVESLAGGLAFTGELAKLGCPALNILLNDKEILAMKNDIEFRLETKTTLENIHVPAPDLCVIIGNLVDNAIEASMEADPKKRNLYIEIGLSYEKSKRFYYFKITNHGKPIPKNMLRKIFNPGHSTKKGRRRGMGLYIVSKTLKKYDGSINVISNDELTCFSIFIPLKESNQHYLPNT